jgi:hypothetical protein
VVGVYFPNLLPRDGFRWEIRYKWEHVFLTALHEATVRMSDIYPLSMDDERNLDVFLLNPSEL